MKFINKSNKMGFSLCFSIILLYSLAGSSSGFKNLRAKYNDKQWMDVQYDVNYYLYTRKNAVNGTILYITSDLASESNFNKSQESKFIIHGFLSSLNSDTLQEIKNQYLTFQDVNVFLVDWKRIAGNANYFVPATSTKDIGEFISIFIRNMIAQGADLSKIHLVGHSLGAHIAGFAGEKLNGEVGRITGLDPALPSFGNIQLAGGRISKRQGKFVDIIHTSGGTLGLLDAVGHADFYPNGGTMPQPGCTLVDFPESCSHGRSWRYFKESIDPSNKFKAIKCKSGTEFREGKCSNEFEFMGEYVSHKARGFYYLITTTTSPFVFSGM